MLKMAFMTFTALDFLWVSWLFMEAGLRPKIIIPKTNEGRLAHD